MTRTGANCRAPSSYDELPMHVRPSMAHSERAPEQRKSDSTLARAGGYILRARMT